VNVRCARHPDVVARSACRECGRPLCALCMYFREGAVVCADHAGAPVFAAPAAAPPVVGPAEPPPAPDSPAWGAGSRLDPLPMALRPGWTDEPLQPRQSGTPEALGIAGLIASLLAAPFSLCCGVGAVVALPIGLISGGLSLAALLTAKRGRNPSAARWCGGFGLGISVVTLAVTACLLIWTVGAFGSSIFSVTTP
jgi:hypothetical protein